MPLSHRVSHKNVIYKGFISKWTGDWIHNIGCKTARIFPYQSMPLVWPIKCMTSHRYSHFVQQAAKIYMYTNDVTKIWFFSNLPPLSVTSYAEGFMYLHHKQTNHPSPYLRDTIYLCSLGLKRVAQIMSKNIKPWWLEH